MYEDAKAIVDNIHKVSWKTNNGKLSGFVSMPIAEAHEYLKKLKDHYLRRSSESDANTVCIINARTLHQRLNIKRDYSNWIKHKIAYYGLIENEDYLKRNNSTNYDRARGSFNRIDYMIPVHIARKIAIVALYGKKALENNNT